VIHQSELVRYFPRDNLSGDDSYFTSVYGLAFLAIKIALSSVSRIFSSGGLEQEIIRNVNTVNKMQYLVLLTWIMTMEDLFEYG